MLWSQAVSLCSVYILWHATPPESRLSAHVAAVDESGDGPDGHHGREERHGGVAARRHGAVALVFLAEAHAALPAALGHAHVVHHEHVNVYVVGAAAPDLHVG